MSVSHSLYITLAISSSVVDAIIFFCTYPIISHTHIKRPIMSIVCSGGKTGVDPLCSSRTMGASWLTGMPESALGKRPLHSAPTWALGNMQLQACFFSSCQSYFWRGISQFLQATADTSPRKMGTLPFFRDSRCGLWACLASWPCWNTVLQKMEMTSCLLFST